jgi:DNA-binding protein H-NS
MSEKNDITQSPFIDVISNRRKLLAVMKALPRNTCATLIDRLIAVRDELEPHFAAELEREKKRQAAASRVVKIMNDNGLSIADLERRPTAQTSQRPRRRNNLDLTSAKYIKHLPDGDVLLWGGRQGRVPRWVEEVRNAGEDIEKYRNPNYIPEAEHHETPGAPEDHEKS